MCLCRSWYSKANKDQSFAAMNTALTYAEQALEHTPNDKATLYNIAMVQQKAAEMLFALPPPKRTLAELEAAIAQAGKAQALFGQLAEDNGQVPYSRDVADQRRKYGESMLRKADDHLRAQREHEGKVQARMDDARARREEEKTRIEEAERARAAEVAAEAEKLREERAKARQAALEMNERWKAEGDDEERVKTEKLERKKVRSAKQANSGFVSDGEEEGTIMPREPRKKRTRKLKKGAAAAAGGEGGEEGGDEEAAFSGGEEGPAKKVRLALKAVSRSVSERLCRSRRNVLLSLARTTRRSQLPLPHPEHPKSNCTSSLFSYPPYVLTDVRHTVRVLRSSIRTRTWTEATTDVSLLVSYFCYAAAVLVLLYIFSYIHWLVDKLNADLHAIGVGQGSNQRRHRPALPSHVLCFEQRNGRMTRLSSVKRVW